MYDYSGGLENVSYKDWCIVLFDDEPEQPGSYTQGYMHRSRIKLIKNTEKINVVNSENNKFLLFSDKETTIKIEFTYFDPAKHDIKLIDKNRITIDDHVPWGIPGYGPSNIDKLINKMIIKSIVVAHKQKKIFIPNNTYNCLYSINYKNINAYKSANKYFLVMHNSDGAGTYDVVWCIDFYSEQKRYLMKLDI